MGTRDARIDAYIAAKPDFARPILEVIRARVHAACQTAEETLKWSMPALLYRGQLLCGMSASKAHAAFSLWRGSELLEADRTRDAWAISAASA